MATLQSRDAQPIGLSPTRRCGKCLPGDGKELLPFRKTAIRRNRTDHPKTEWGPLKLTEAEWAESLRASRRWACVVVGGPPGSRSRHLGIGELGYLVVHASAYPQFRRSAPFKSVRADPIPSMLRATRLATNPLVARFVKVLHGVDTGPKLSIVATPRVTAHRGYRECPGHRTGRGPP
jgi:hypothetical protein